MALHNHRVGDIVGVFDHPEKKEGYQGIARIVFVDPETPHYYKVIFLNDKRAERVGRYIY